MNEIYKNQTNAKVSLDTVRLNHDGRDGFSLHMEYIVEDENRVERYIFPYVRLPIQKDRFAITTEFGFMMADVGFGTTRLLPDPDFSNTSFTVKTIKEKTKEMTLEEIEKKLGHKVKIISKEET